MFGSIKKTFSLAGLMMCSKAPNGNTSVPVLAATPHPQEQLASIGIATFVPPIDPSGLRPTTLSPVVITQQNDTLVAVNDDKGETLLEYGIRLDNGTWPVAKQMDIRISTPEKAMFVRDPHQGSFMAYSREFVPFAKERVTLEKYDEKIHGKARFSTQQPLMAQKGP